MVGARVAPYLQNVNVNVDVTGVELDVVAQAFGRTRSQIVSF